MTNPRLSTQFPWLFAGLPTADVEIRDHHYSSPFHASSPLQVGVIESIRTLLDRYPEPPIDPRAIAFDDVVGLLLDLIEKLGGEEVRQSAAAQEELLLDAASGAKTLGHQYARVFYRHPGLTPWLRVPLKPRETEGLRSQRFDRRNLARYFGATLLDRLRLLHYYDRILPRLREILGPSKRFRADRAPEIRSTLLAEFPELENRAKRPRDVLELTPARAAKHVVAARVLRGRSIDARRVEQLLAEGRKFRRFYEDPPPVAIEEGADDLSPRKTPARRRKTARSTQPAQRRPAPKSSP